MRRFLAVWAVVWVTTNVQAQSSLEMLQKDLDQLKEEHQEATSKNLEVFLSSLDEAQADPAAAEKLYLAAGGTAPTPAPVKTGYEHETPTEAAQREALDKAESASFGGTLQLHCGMMKFAALLIQQPEKPSLEADWVAWLKSAAQAYPQVDVKVTDSRATPDTQPDASAKGQRHHHPPASPAADTSPSVRDLTMKESPIGPYLGFESWDDKEQGKWKVADIPKLYRDKVLDPLRQSPNAATLQAWDVYIAMMNADQADEEKWTDVDYPALQFEKGADDFTMQPGTDKLEALVAIIKAHPAHPLQDDWIKRVHDMIAGLQNQRAGGASTTTASSENLAPIQPDSTNSAPITATTIVPPVTNSAPVPTPTP